MLTQELYLLLNCGTPSAVLMPGPDRVPIVPDPPPLILASQYLPAGFTESQLLAAQAATVNEKCDLFIVIGCPEGPPYRTGIIFTFQEVLVNATWFDGKVARHGATLHRFAATTPVARWVWTEDVRAGKSGYLLTGHSRESALWQIFRVEVDALKRSVLTVAPIHFTVQCPRADFTSVVDLALQAEVSQQYEDLCRRVSSAAYRDVPTKTRNIVEGLVANRLKTQGHPVQMELSKDLKTVKSLLENAATRKSCEWTDLEYHLLHKIRLVHSQTHPGPVVGAGKQVRPGFALSVVDDLVELLRIWGYTAI